MDGYINRYALFAGGYASTAFGWISRVKDWENRAFPFSLGKDFSGVVVQTGQGVTHVKPGDEVSSHALNITLRISSSKSQAVISRFVTSHCTPRTRDVLLSSVFPLYLRVLFGRASP